MEGITKFDEWYMKKEKNNWELLEVKILFFPPNYSKISHYQLIVIWRHQFQSRAQTIKYFTLSRNPVEKSLAFGGIRGEDTGAEYRHKLGRYLYETRAGARRLYCGEFILVLRAIKQGPVVTVGKSWEWVIFQNEALLKGFQVTWMHKMAGSVRLFENSLKGIILRLLVSLGWHYDPDHASWELLGNQL